MATPIKVDFDRENHRAALYIGGIYVPVIRAEFDQLGDLTVTFDGDAVDVTERPVIMGMAVTND